MWIMWKSMWISYPNRKKGEENYVLEKNQRDSEIK